MTILPELLFCLVPLLVLGLSLIYINKGLMHLLASPEWSFASAILLGQAVVRFVFGAAANRRVRRIVASFLVAVIVVLELIPTLAVMSFTIITHETQGAEKVPGWLMGLQLFFFVTSLLTFLLVGGVGEAIAPGSPEEEGSE